MPAPYTYNKATTFLNGLSLSGLHSEIEADSGVTTQLDGVGEADGNVTVAFGGELDEGEEAALAVVIAKHPAPNLTAAKLERMALVDMNTAGLIGAGFTYDDKLFSESSTMQRNLLVLNTRDLRGALGGLLPLVISTKDNLGEVVLTTLAEFLAFYNGAEIQALTQYGAGNAIKSQVRAITNDVGEPDVAPNYHDLADAIAAAEAVADER